MSLLPPAIFEEPTWLTTDDGLQLEGLLSEVEGGRGWAVLCHPHPMHGGTMDNKVVVTATRTAAAAGLSTLRFNFRGVGRSQGRYGQGVAEVADVLAAIAAVRATRWLGFGALLGFSFGAVVSARAASETELGLDSMALIGLPLEMFEIPRPPLPSGGLQVVIGDQDQFCKVESARRFVAGYGSPAAVLKVVAGSDHFFGGHLGALSTALREGLPK
ncbi:MAG: hypothetical protein AUK47_10405 [Deltaproteobacteria bacterium CG2_30_63_29]|nr:MAG: hypothetical protein AUK47_10405 [Deltaproteobacteria bacterium CG2_30_63_29]PIW00139.1 MAG: alpha/beta hydrolase [Deltaproteobacteria bacterium CG17_big_fil_post_rev_8_21_14_2_50_63_7]PJB41459.1 MAG: alpha/beta hydrolase [Deltaproteobacteria bacterium CG_4_9_14_3_um_filter_63_12]